MVECWVKKTILIFDFFQAGLVNHLMTKISELRQTLPPTWCGTFRCLHNVDENESVCLCRCGLCDLAHDSSPLLLRTNARQVTGYWCPGSVGNCICFIQRPKIEFALKWICVSHVLVLVFICNQVLVLAVVQYLAPAPEVISETYYTYLLMCREAVLAVPLQLVRNCHKYCSVVTNARFFMCT